MGKFWMRRRIVTDGTPPTLTSPADAADGQTAAIISVSTDEGNGRMYWGIYSTSSVPGATAEERAANLKAGNGAVVAGNAAVTATGSQSFSPAGLAAATLYYAHFLHRDDAGNESTIASANGFTTDPVPSPVTALGISGLQTAIETNFGTVWAGAGVAAFDTTTTVTTLTALQTALNATKADYTKRWKIICDWDDRATDLSAVGLQVTGTSSWYDNGGCVYITKAVGRTPCIGKLWYSYGVRGVHFDGIGFGNRYSGSGAQNTQYCIQIAKNSTYVGHQIIRFDNCKIGAGAWGGVEADYVTAIQSNPGMENGQIVLSTCLVKGYAIGLKVSMKNVRLHMVDMQQGTGDDLSVNGHTTGVSYRSVLWMTQCTMRNVIDNLANRSAHKDNMQTGYSLDNHIGYDVLVDECIFYAPHSYSGTGGGGTQVSYHDDYPTADNRFCIRNTIGLCTSPAAFRFFSPNATYRSYMDKCIFNRSGSTPSSFTGDDGAQQDFNIGMQILYPESSFPDLAEEFMTVTDCFLGRMPTTAGAKLNYTNAQLADPRAAFVGTSNKPETFHVGRDFTRGGVLANNIANKLAYAITNDAGTQANFVADIWANWEPLPAYASYNIPDPTLISWASPS